MKLKPKLLNKLRSNCCHNSMFLEAKIIVNPNRNCFRNKNALVKPQRNPHSFNITVEWFRAT